MRMHRGRNITGMLTVREAHSVLIEAKTTNSPVDIDETALMLDTWSVDIKVWISNQLKKL